MDFGIKGVSSGRDEVEGKKPRGEGTSTASAGDGAGGRPGDGAGGRTASTEKEKPVAVAVVKSPEQIEEEKRQARNARKRERYRQQKEENGGSVKPRKVKGKKEEQPKVDTSQIDALLLSTSAIIASRPGMEIWKLSPAECKAISEPLGNMIAKSEKLAELAQYSDAVALTVACVTIFGPRAMITVQTKKEEQKKRVTGNTTETNVKPDQKRKTPVSDSAGTGPDGKRGRGTADDASNVPDLPFLGTAFA